MKEIDGIKKLSKIQQEFFYGVVDALVTNEINDYQYEIKGNSETFVCIRFREISLYIYNDGGSQFVSDKKIVKRFLFFPSKIDWRIESVQYQNLESLKQELFKSLKEVFVILGNKKVEH